MEKKPTQSKGKENMEKQESSHEKEREFDIIQVDSDAEDDQIRILNSLLKNRQAQIVDFQMDLERSKDFIHFIQLQNK